MRAIVISSCVVAVVIFAKVSSSQGEGDTDSTASIDETIEPITGTAAMPIKGNETPPRDPFKPYDIGGAEAAWKYEDLTADEKVVADQA